jgi:hypothetical protein
LAKYRSIFCLWQNIVCVKRLQRLTDLFRDTSLSNLSRVIWHRATKHERPL